MTQYPLSIFTREVVVALTLVVPVAFANWYPTLYLLGREDPFGMPAWLQFASPLAALVTVVLALLVWRTGRASLHLHRQLRPRRRAAGSSRAGYAASRAGGSHVVTTDYDRSGSKGGWSRKC